MAKLIKSTRNTTRGVIASGQVGLSTDDFIKKAKEEGIEYTVTQVAKGDRGTRKAHSSTKKSKPERDNTMVEIAKMLQSQGFEVKVSKKGLSYLNGKQWLTVAVTANRKKPDGLEPFEIEEEEETEQEGEA